MPTVLKYGLIRNFRSPISALASAVAPIVVIILLGSSESPAPLVNILAMIILMASHLSAGLILQDRLDGFVTRVLLSPVSTVSYKVQNMIAAMMPPVIYCTVLAVMGIVRYNWGIQITFGITFSVLLFAFVCTAFAFFFTTFFKSAEGNNYSYLFVAIVMTFFTGLLLPTEALPQALQHVGAVFHPYWLLRGVSTLVTYGLTRQFWLYKLVMVLFAAVFLVLGGRKRE